MKILLMVLATLAMLATLGILFAGLFSMARGNDAMRSNMFMRWRVILQAAALGLVALLMLLARG
ncbi:MAG: twin transmembrane helix small protein [Acetobacteraceae bacterium]|nr:twin transmembrane helix small protein [Acetobacteraceae bacterium]